MELEKYFGEWELNFCKSMKPLLCLAKLRLLFNILFLGEQLYPHNLDQARNSREEIRKFAEDAKDLGVQYIGLCCGNYPSLIREVAEVYGKKPPASKYAMKGRWISGDVPKTERGRNIRKFLLGE